MRFFIFKLVYFSSCVHWLLCLLNPCTGNCIPGRPGLFTGLALPGLCCKIIVIIITAVIVVVRVIISIIIIVAIMVIFRACRVPATLPFPDFSYYPYPTRNAVFSAGSYHSAPKESDFLTDFDKLSNLPLYFFCFNCNTTMCLYCPVPEQLLKIVQLA